MGRIWGAGAIPGLSHGRWGAAEEMEREELLRRITVDPNVLVGKPTVRGLRISVEQILHALASGVAAEDLLQDYPELDPEDIQACIAYAANLVAGERVCPVYQNGRLRIR